MKADCGNMGKNNLFLKGLPGSVIQTILKESECMPLPIETCLIRQGEHPRYVYLLTSGVASIVVSMEEGGTAEVGMTGSEGVVGAGSLLGPTLPQATSVMQVSGEGYRTPLRVMRALLEEDGSFRRRLLEFVQVQLTSSARLSACNRLHEAEGRLARWLLTAADLARSEMLPLTQEFLAQMLGSQRTTVALVAGALQRGGLIEYSRGKVRITNREGLESAACACYFSMRDSRRALEQEENSASSANR